MNPSEIQLKPHEKVFVRILVRMKLSQDQICGIMAMLNGNDAAMTEVVAFIKTYPEATPSQIIKAASQAVGIA